MFPTTIHTIKVVKQKGAFDKYYVEGLNTGFFHDEYEYLARDGEVLAHDILEHQNGIEAIGPITEELQGLGSLFFTRGITNDVYYEERGFKSRKDYNLNFISNAVASNVMQYAKCPLGNTIPEQPTTEYDDDLRDIIRLADEQIKYEAPRYNMHVHDCFVRVLLLEQAFRGMQKGIRIQKERFGTPEKAFAAFKALENAFINIGIVSYPYRTQEPIENDIQITITHLEDGLDVKTKQLKSLTM